MQKEAIDIGITDYLVKPVTGAQLIGTLKKIGQKIEEERGKQKQQAPEEARSAGRQRLFRHMVSGKHTYASVFQEAKELGLELIAEQYNIMLLQLFSEEKEDVLPEKIKAFEQELEKYMEQSGNLIVAKQSRAEYDFVLKGTGQQSRGDDRAGKKPAGRVFPERDGGGVCRGARDTGGAFQRAAAVLPADQPVLFQTLFGRAQPDP